MPAALRIEKTTETMSKSFSWPLFPYAPPPSSSPNAHDPDGSPGRSTSRSKCAECGKSSSALLGWALPGRRQPPPQSPWRWTSHMWQM